MCPLCESNAFEESIICVAIMPLLAIAFRSFVSGLTDFLCQTSYGSLFVNAIFW